MIGRGIFGNPWLFAPLHGKSAVPTLEEKLRVMVEHTKLFEKLLGDVKNFAVMKKHFKAYVRDDKGTLSDTYAQGNPWAKGDKTFENYFVKKLFQKYLKIFENSATK